MQRDPHNGRKAISQRSSCSLEPQLEEEEEGVIRRTLNERAVLSHLLVHFSAGEVTDQVDDSLARSAVYERYEVGKVDEQLHQEGQLVSADVRHPQTRNNDSAGRLVRLLFLLYCGALHLQPQTPFTRLILWENK